MSKKESKKIECCEDMEGQINFTCEEHENTDECPDKLIKYSEMNDSYGIIIHDGGSSIIKIKYCPWCGKLL